MHHHKTVVDFAIQHALDVVIRLLIGVVSGSVLVACLALMLLARAL